jgi:hypothetical protein
LAIIYTTADEGHRAQRFHYDRITPGGTPGFGGKFTTEMDLIQAKFKDRYYQNMNHIKGEPYVKEAGNQCKITTQYVHETNNQLC